MSVCKCVMRGVEGEGECVDVQDREVEMRSGELRSEQEDDDLSRTSEYETWSGETEPVHLGCIYEYMNTYERRRPINDRRRLEIRQMPNERLSY